MTEDEMVERHHQLDGHEFEHAQGDGEGQGSLACCSPWGRKESDTTERRNTCARCQGAYGCIKRAWQKFTAFKGILYHPVDAQLLSLQCGPCYLLPGRQCTDEESLWPGLPP